jgi:YD repeat-containing protein
MPIRSGASATVAGLFLLIYSGSPLAQSPVPDYYEELGLDPFRQQSTDLDPHEFVDPFSGGLHRRYVDVSIPGEGGLDIQVIRAYNNVQFSFTERGPVGVGWTMHFGRVLHNIPAYNICNENHTPPAVPTSADNPVLEHPDGRRELLYAANDTGGPYAPFTWVTTSRWKAVCVPAGSGGLIVTSPEGVEYTMNVQSGGGPPAYYTSLIRDRNNNTLTIRYKPISSLVAAMLVSQVEASDGRIVDFFYTNEAANGYRLNRITYNNISWEYEHTPVPNMHEQWHLSQVRRPDGRTWQYTYYPNTSLANQYSLQTVTSPYGAVTTYTYDYVSFGDQRWTVVLTSKSQTGVGIPSSPGANWTYDHVPGANGSPDVTTVIGPSNRTVYQHFGYPASLLDPSTIWKIGMLLQRTVYPSSTDNTVIEQETLDWGKQRISTENQARTDIRSGSDFDSYAPILLSRVIQRDGTNYTTTFSGHDVHGNPGQSVETGNAPTSRTTTYTYLSNPTKWLLREVQTQTISGIGAPALSKGFDTDGNPTTMSRFGVTTTYGYTPEGDVSSVRDALDKTTILSNHFRGIPRTEQRPEGVTIQRAVNATGTIANIRDGRLNLTQYTYDGLKRLTGITFPIGTPATINWSSGISRTRTITRGAYVETVTFDSLGRPVQVDREGIRQTMSYDSQGRLKFKSYPCATTCTNGVSYKYDAIDRVTEEKGPTGTRGYRYLSDGRVQITTERGFIHTHQFDSYGDPNERLLATVTTPQMTTTITRNLIGLVTGIAQGGVSRGYSYDGRMFLTGMTDPETGTTTLGRDAVGNLKSKVINSGVQTARADFGYDDLHRLETVTYATGGAGGPNPDAAQGITYVYDANDNIKRAFSSEVSNDYDYDAVNKLERETLNIAGGPSFATIYGYNALDHLTTLTYPSGRSVGFSPDDLGRPHSVGGYVTAVAYHPNSSPSSVSFGNGVTTTASLTLEQRVDRLLSSGSAGPVVDLDYDYDDAGNVTRIADNLDPVYTRTMNYDATERLTDADGVWGNGVIGYDGANNITSMNLGTDTATYTYSSNRLNQLTKPGQTYTFGYDHHGNIISDSRYQYRFNVANQLASVLTTAGAPDRSYRYDGMGFRFREDRGGATTYQVHDRQGRLLGEYDSAGLAKRENFYLASRLVAVAETDPPGGYIAFDSTSGYSVSESGGNATITVNRRAPSAVAARVEYRARAGSATAISDFTEVTGFLDWDAGQTGVRQFTVPIGTDLTDEINETISLTLFNATGGQLENPQTSTLTIVDDDGPSVTLSLAGGSIAETNGSATVTATLSAPSVQAVTVNLAYGGTATHPADYSRSASITIPAGSTSNSATLSAAPDTVDEADETIVVSINSVTNGTANGSQQVTATIIDDDGPSVTLALSPATVAESGTTATVTATLSAVSLQPVIVDLAFSGTATLTSDYTRSATSITIGAGATSGSVTLTSALDTVDETDETVIVDIAQVTNAGENGTQRVTLTITDDDGPSVTLSLAGSPMAETGGAATVTATLSAVSPQEVTVNLAFTGTATNVSDYTRSANSITIAAGATSGFVTLAAAHDLMDEPGADETIIVDVTTVTNGTPNGPQQVTASIVDDEGPPLVMLSLAGGAMAEAGATATVTATMSPTSSQPVTVALAFGGSATLTDDYSRSGTSITIAPGFTNGAITLTAAQDGIDELNETIVVDISTVTNGAENGTQQVTASITDDDGPNVTLSLAGSPMVEAPTGSATVTATLSATSVQPVTVFLAFSGSATSPTDYSRTGTNIVIPAGSTTGSVTLIAVHDTTDEVNENIVVDVSSVDNGSESGAQQVAASITDDDGPTVTLTLSGATTMIETGGTTSVRASMSHTSPQVVVVDLAFSGTATLTGDYTTTGTSITVPAGATYGTVTLAAVHDLVDEDNNETVVVDVVAVTNGTENGAQQVTTSVVDDDDYTPDQFTFTDVSFAALNTVQMSNAVFVAGVSGAVPVSVVGGEYSKNGGPYTSAPGSVGQLDTVRVRHTSANATVASVSTTLTVGGVSDTFTSTTEPVLAHFSAAAQSATEGTGANSAVVATVNLSIATGDTVTVPYTIGGTATNPADHNAGSGSVVLSPGQTSAPITFTVVGDGLDEANETVVLTMGTPTNASRVPDAFAFTPLWNVGRSWTMISNAITVSGTDATVRVTVSGGSYSKNGGAYTTVTGSAVTGDTITVQHTSSAMYSTGVTTTLTVGGVSGSFTSTTIEKPFCDGCIPP